MRRALEPHGRYVVRRGRECEGVYQVSCIAYQYGQSEVDKYELQRFLPEQKMIDQVEIVRVEYDGKGDGEDKKFRV